MPKDKPAEKILFKDIFSPDFIRDLGQRMQKISRGFKPEKLEKDVFNNGWKEMELKQRMRRISVSLHTQMPQKFSEAASLLLRLVGDLQNQPPGGGSFPSIFIPDYIEVFVIDFPEISAAAMETVTPWVSCEFAVRPFIIRYPREMLKKLKAWSLHPNEHVRRLSSEGCRPRLPWAMALTEFKKDPSPLLPILENLKNDPSEYVRRSVANHLNDISRDHPDVVLSLLKSWKGISRETDALLKHACRTLMKQGKQNVLKHFGLHRDPSLEITGFSLRKKKVKFGDALEFTFGLRNKGKKTAKARMEYALYFMKANGSLAKKVFKISERSLPPGQILSMERKHKFVPITTRVYYPGKHAVALILNGEEFEKKFFELIMAGK